MGLLKKSFLPIQIKLSKDHINQLLDIYATQFEAGDNISIQNIKILQLEEISKISLTTTGLLKGDLQIDFNPSFDVKTYQIKIENFQLDISDGNLLTKSAGWMAKNLLSNRLSKIMEEKINLSISQLIKEKLRKKEVIDLPDAFQLTYKLEGVKITNALFKSDYLILDIEIEGNAMIHSA